MKYETILKQRIRFRGRKNFWKLKMYNSDCIVSSIKRRRFDLYNTYNHLITNLVGIIQFLRRENSIIRKVFVLQTASMKVSRYRGQ